MLNIIIFGPPGCGKGTQSNLMTDKYKLMPLSTGDIFRKNVRLKTALGQLVKKYLDQGKLVPDQVTIDMLNQEINKFSDSEGVIFDGFPRTLDQAEALDKLLLSSNQEVSLTLSLDVSEKELFTRLIERGEQSGRSDDKDKSIILNRIEVYKKQTLILKEFYEKKGNFFEVNGEGSIHDIAKRIFNVIDSYLK